MQALTATHRSTTSCKQPALGLQLEAAFLDESVNPFVEPVLPIGEAHELCLAELTPADRAALIEAATAASEAAL